MLRMENFGQQSEQRFRECLFIAVHQCEFVEDSEIGSVHTCDKYDFFKASGNPPSVVAHATQFLYVKGNKKILRDDASADEMVGFTKDDIVSGPFRERAFEWTVRMDAFESERQRYRNNSVDNWWI